MLFILVAIKKDICTTALNIDKCFLSSTMISEGSCDSEDWKKILLSDRNKLHFKIYSNKKHF